MKSPCNNCANQIKVLLIKMAMRGTPLSGGLKEAAVKAGFAHLIRSAPPSGDSGRAPLPAPRPAGWRPGDAD